MPFLIPVTLFGWIPLILLVFQSLPPRRALVTFFIAGWLFLPYAGYDLPGMPDYSKRSATSLGVFLATVLYRSDWLYAVRLRWFDLPMLTYCLCPIVSSLTNELGLYDGLSTSFDSFVTWALPYLLGRVYFTRIEHLREMAMGLAVGGLIYVPFCVWEFRMSPQLHTNVYGFDPRGFGEIVFSGYRPKVFMSTGLELGVWMTATAVTAFWLWASGSLKQLWGTAFGTLLFALMATAVNCRVTGAWILMILGVSTWYGLRSTGARLPALALLLVPILYMTTRSTGIFAGEEGVNLVRTVLNERRADSFGMRVVNEDMLVEKALQRPFFGWGGWGRSRITNASGEDISITDGMWVIVIGTTGLVGLIAFNAALLLPMAMLIVRYPPRAWQTPTIAPACALAVVTNLYSVDCLANAFVNPIFILTLGAVTGAVGLRGTSPQSQSDGAELSQLLEHYSGVGAADDGTGLYDDGRSAGHDPREEAAIRLGTLARSLMEHGMSREAEEAWLAALQHWAALAAAHPDDPDYRRCWLDGLNDAAWSLIAQPDPEPRALARAIQLAEQTVTQNPEGAAYWNTLGIAYFRAGDGKAAIHALEQSVELGGGGTSFDFFFLAMACWQQGNREQARRWYARANDWMAQHNPDHADLLHFRAEAAALLDSHPLPV